MPDLDADTTAMEDGQLLAYQQELTRTRLAVNDKARQVQAELDQRAQQRAARRAAEDAQLGAITKPPAQELLAVPAPDGS